MGNDARPRGACRFDQAAGRTVRPAHQDGRPRRRPVRLRRRGG